MKQNTPLAIVILAAGKGSRMKSDLPKVMHALAGKPIISVLIDQAQRLKPERIIVVTAPDMQGLRDLVKPHIAVIQEKQNGTADAVKAALPALEGFDGNVLILLGDEPFVPLNVLGEMAANKNPSVMAIIPEDATGLGRVLTDESGYLDRIVEDKDCTDEEREIYLCNAGNFCVPSKSLAKWLNGVGNKNAQGEYYLTDMPAVATKDGMKFEVFTVPIDHVWGINDRLQLAEHERIYQEMMRDHFLIHGVTMLDPESVYFHHDTKIAAGVIIEPNVFFGPGVEIEDGVHIKAFCHIEGAKIGAGTTVGPFARLRPGSEIGQDVRIGNFVEIKKSSIGGGAKISHLAYVGDCTMGADVNFSCGAITVNYDGYDKFETHIGDGAMIGSNVSLVAPVEVGAGAIIAAGSTITQNVPADSLAIGREKDSVREGWAGDFRAKKQNGNSSGKK